VQAQMPLLVDLIATELLKAGIAVAPRGAGM
jgi:hypothetical protein